MLFLFGDLMCTKDVANVAKKIKNLGGDVLFFCIGNELRRDDGVAIFLCNELSKYKAFKDKVLIAYSAPIMYTDLVKNKNVRNLIIVDAINGCKEPGDIVFMKFSNLGEEISLTYTHDIPLSTIIRHLKEELKNLEVYILGFQVKDTNFGLGLSEPILRSVKALLNKLLTSSPP